MRCGCSRGRPCSRAVCRDVRRSNISVGKNVGVILLVHCTMSRSRRADHLIRQLTLWLNCWQARRRRRDLNPQPPPCKSADRYQVARPALTGFHPSPTSRVLVGFRFLGRLAQGPAVRAADRRHSLRLGMLTMTRSAYVQVRCAVFALWSEHHSGYAQQTRPTSTQTCLDFTDFVGPSSPSQAAHNPVYGVLRAHRRRSFGDSLGDIPDPHAGGLDVGRGRGDGAVRDHTARSAMPSPAR
jgi:hypothetical protein